VAKGISFGLLVYRGYGEVAGACARFFGTGLSITGLHLYYFVDFVVDTVFPVKGS